MYFDMTKVQQTVIQKCVYMEYVLMYKHPTLCNQTRLTSVFKNVSIHVFLEYMDI